MFKVDLHTHSVASPDGGITALQYGNALASGLLDVIAITDHNRTDFAIELQRQLGDRIIVGQEIMTTAGEIIGLYLSESVPAQLSPADTIAAIKAQNGIVYIPHPFETVRKGMHPAVLEELQSEIELIEVCNGRAFLQNRSERVLVWAKLNRIPGIASSDAHGYVGLGKTYTSMAEIPTRESLVRLAASGTPVTSSPGVRSLLYPKYHSLRKKLGKNK